jgi:hypothetical protein
MAFLVRCRASAKVALAGGIAKKKKGGNTWKNQNG